MLGGLRFCVSLKYRLVVSTQQWHIHDYSRCGMLHKVEKNLSRHIFVLLCIWKSYHIYLLYMQLVHTFFFFKHKTSVRHFVPFPRSTDNPDFWSWKKTFLLLSNMLLCNKFKYVIWNRFLRQETYWITKHHNSTHNLLFLSLEEE